MSTDFAVSEGAITVCLEAAVCNLKVNYGFFFKSLRVRIKPYIACDSLTHVATDGSLHTM